MWGGKRKNLKEWKYLNTHASVRANKEQSSHFYIWFMDFSSSLRLNNTDTKGTNLKPKFVGQWVTKYLIKYRTN